MKKQSKIKRSKCTIESPIKFKPCYMPELDVKELRKKVRAYLKGFNKAIEKAIKDDILIRKIECRDDFSMGYRPNDLFCNHTISFTDKEYIDIV